MKRNFVTLLIFGALTTGTVMGALVVLYTYQVPMGARFVTTGNYDVQLQTLEGAPIDGYGWGEFTIGQTKTFTCQVKNVGRVPLNMTWTVSDFPLEGWILLVNFPEQNGYPAMVWNEDESWGPIQPNGGFTIEIVLTENGAEVNPEISFNFLLNSGEP